MTESTRTEERARGARRPDGPHLGALAIVTWALTMLGLALGALLSGGAALGSPFVPADDLVARYQEHWAAVRLAAWLQLGSAIPLGIYAATAYARLLRLGVRVPGPGIGFYGGILASTSLVASAALQWTLSRPEVTADATTTQALAFTSFLLGGVGFVVGLGLLIAGIAVPALILRLLPRWLAWTGLVIAALAELAFVSMVFEPLQVLLPIGRFGGLLWLIVAGFLLPHHRAPRNADAT